MSVPSKIEITRTFAKRLIRFTYFLPLLICMTCPVQDIISQEQKPPYWEDIQAFKKQDSIHPPGKNNILFIGSSSFTNWKDIQSYFPSHTILNRGFGGSSLTDLIRYSHEIIVPYKPKQIVIYCGENDLAASDTITAAIVVNRFKALYSLIRTSLKRVPIVYISLKPSPSRRHLMPQMEIANEAIQNFIAEKRKIVFIDVYHPMLQPDGSPRPELFLADDLHLNADGYALWQKLIEPHLKK